jgi:glycosyltransferase involved in cell wall biosynthesis
VRVVIVLKDVPMHEGSAPGKTAVGLLRGLLEHGVDVHAVAARQHFTPPGEPPAGLPVEVVEVPPERVSRLARLRRPRGDLGRGAFAERVRAAARGADVVHLEETETLWAGGGLAVPSVLHVHYLVRRDRPLAAPWSREGRELLELALAERAVCRRMRQLVASSPLVAAELRRRAPRAEVTLAPLSLDPAHYAAAALADPVAGFIGTAAWPPTAAAATRLVRDVWPLVRRAAPSARLRVAGRGMEGVVGGAEGVEVVGSVASASEFFAGLSLLLFPLGRGSGMKVKTLEALVSGVPVVTTVAGAEGVEPNGGVVVADDDWSLATAAAEVLADEGARRERGRAARATFERNYSPGVATAALVELYRRIAGLP